MNCQIEFANDDVGMPCGKPAVAKCADCGSAICSDCSTECCGDRSRGRIARRRERLMDHMK